MEKLVLTFKETTLKEYVVDKAWHDKDLIFVGRKPDNEICIDVPVVSGQHAKLYRENARLVIEDLNSTNGTFVNKKKITKHVLCNKDVIFIGKHTIIYLTDNPIAQAEEGAEGAGAPAKESDMDRTMVLQTREHKSMTGTTGTAPSPGATQAAAAAAARVGGLSVIEGSSDENEYMLTARLTTIGKSDNAQIKLKGLFAPKTGALINRGTDGYVVAPPPGSKIKVNGETVEDRHRLKEGDILEVGDLKLQFFLK